MRIAVALSLVAFVGCGVDTNDDEDTVETGETSSAVIVQNKLAANKLAANKLAANKLAANKLAANKLAANKLELNEVGASDLIATEEGRELLGFIISCAVKEGEILVAEFEGETYEFFGELGLANKWLNKPIDDEGMGWVSACLFSRVNASNVPIPISLRGPSNKLTASQEEKDGWSLQEGAFYGNFFVEEGEDIEWYACTGEDQFAGETGGLIERDCAEPCTPGAVIPDGNSDPSDDEICQAGQTWCGFTHTGSCGDFDDRYSCKRYNEDGTYYRRCETDDKYKDGNNGQPKWTGGHKDTHRQVITVWVTP